MRFNITVAAPVLVNPLEPPVSVRFPKMFIADAALMVMELLSVILPKFVVLFPKLSELPELELKISPDKVKPFPDIFIVRLFVELIVKLVTVKFVTSLFEFLEGPPVRMLNVILPLLLSVGAVPPAQFVPLPQFPFEVEFQVNCA